MKMISFILLGLVCVANANRFIIPKCNAPPAVENAEYTTDSSGGEYNEGVKATYSCNGGYHLRGDNVLTCKDLGNGEINWAPKKPTCLRTCEDFSVANAVGIKYLGRKEGEPVVAGNYAWFGCAVGYEAKNGIQDVKCQDNGEYESGECIDVDECANNDDDCDDNAECNNIDGSYTCACNSGYSGDGKSCEELKCGNPGTGSNTVDQQLEDNYSADQTVTYECKAGYDVDASHLQITCNLDPETNEVSWSADPPSCTDVDECANNDDDCDDNAECNNIDGSYTCACKSGYSGDGKKSCEELKCGNPGTGSNTVDQQLEDNYSADQTVTYECKAGYDVDASHLQITCNLDPETNEVSWSADPPSCTDVDECANNDDDCDDNAECNNIDGSYTCACKSGYSGDGKKSCEELKCGNPGTGSNTVDQQLEDNYSADQTVTYECKAGYDVDASHLQITCNLDPETNEVSWSADPPSCTDVDECANNDDDCDDNAECNNIDGSYTCACKSGYSGDGKKSCEELKCGNPGTGSNTVDQQLEDNYSADQTVTYECKAGYYVDASHLQITCNLDPETNEVSWSADPPSCTDVDECANNDDDCDDNAECNNIDGSYTCACKSGYSGDGKKSCEELKCGNPGTGSNTVDQQLEDNYSADQTVTYECKAGYYVDASHLQITCNLDPETNEVSWSADPPSCTDVDECANNDDDCDDNAECNNIDGSYTCACKSGYSGDGKKSCEELKCGNPGTGSNTVDQQLEDNYSADQTVTYECKAGYDVDASHLQITCNLDPETNEVSWSADPPSCTDVDECANNDDDCDDNAECNNIDGSYTCACKSGYSGDGKKSCEELKCGNPGTGSNTVDQQLEDNYSADQTVTYECKAGYDVDASHLQITCNLDPETNEVSWSADPPSCTDVDECANNDDDCDDNAECNNIDGSYTCACKSGYSGDGKKSCEELKCGNPGKGSNTVDQQLEDNYSADQTVTYECKAGYDVDASHLQITCNLDPQTNAVSWSDDPPSCTDNTCPTFKEKGDVYATIPAGSSYAVVDIDAINATDSSDSKVTVTCDPPPQEGATLGEGPCVIHCTATDEAGNSCSDSYTIFVTKAVINCPDGYVLQDSRCLRASDTPTFFASACKTCESLQGTLATVSTAEEVNEVRKFLADKNYSRHWVNVHRMCDGNNLQTLELNDVESVSFSAHCGGDCGYADGNGVDGACCWNRLPVICEAPPLA